MKTNEPLVCTLCGDSSDYFKHTPRAQCRRCYVQQYAVEHRAVILAQRRVRTARNAAARVVYRATPEYPAARERLTALRRTLKHEEKEALVGIQLPVRVSPFYFLLCVGEKPARQRPTAKPNPGHPAGFPLCRRVLR